MANDAKCSTEPAAYTAASSPANAGPHVSPAESPARSAGADEPHTRSEPGTGLSEISSTTSGFDPEAAALAGLITGEQPVYTATGPLTAEHLAESGEAFVGLVHDPALGRYAARKARVVPAGEGPAYAVTADGDTFRVGAGAAFELSQRGSIPVEDLREGRRIMACTIYAFSGGYPRVNLWDGKTGKESLHRLVAADVMGVDIEGMVVHHIDEDKQNNAPENLRVYDSQSEHAKLHNRRLVEAGEHPFQLNVYPKAGEQNGMHKGGAFWSDPVKAKRYRQKKRKELLDRDPVALQSASVRRRTLNIGHKIRNAGYTFATMEEYLDAHEAVVGFSRRAHQKAKADSILRQFGSIQGFIAALDEENHRVERIEPLGFRPLYAVVVSAAGGDSVWTPPVVIWPVVNTSPFGAGVVLHT